MFGKLAVAAALTVLVWTAFVRPLGAHGPRQVYVVRPYDTLWTIAASRYPGDTRDAVWRIERRNGLSGATLRPGQRLVLP